MKKCFLLVPLVASASAFALPQCELQKLVAGSPDTSNFGFSAAFSGQLVVVGAPSEASPIGEEAGAAYAFLETPSGWTEIQRLIPSDWFPEQLFGYSVAVQGNRALVGAPRDHGSVLRAGAAYIFEYNGSSWIEVVQLAASDIASNMEFGESVALQGDRALIGAPGANGARGAVYVFEHSGGMWIEVAKLAAPDAQPIDNLGDSVALEGGLAIAGAPGKDEDAGAVYVFDQAAGWAFAAKLVPLDPAPDQYFGHSVAIDSATIVVGAWGDDTLAKGSGAAYVFESSVGNWTQTAKLLAGDGHYFNFFGEAVAVSGDTVVIGAHEDRPGSAYVFVRESSNWRHAAVIAPSDGSGPDDFGSAVAIEGDLVLVGSDDASGPHGNLGAAYLFRLPLFVAAYCFGESCPCGNDDGVRGCANSLAGIDLHPQGALLATCGSGSVATDDLVLTLSHLPPNKFGLFYMGGGQTQVPFGDGFQCVSAGGLGIFRYNPPQSSGSGGMLTLGPGIVARSQSFAINGRIDPGETWYFQGWYRDPMGPCGTGFNLSNALAVTFAP